MPGKSHHFSRTCSCVFSPIKVTKRLQCTMYSGLGRRSMLLLPSSQGPSVYLSSFSHRLPFTLSPLQCSRGAGRPQGLERRGSTRRGPWQAARALALSCRHSAFQHGLKCSSCADRTQRRPESLPAGGSCQPVAVPPHPGPIRCWNNNLNALSSGSCHAIYVLL